MLKKIFFIKIVFLTNKKKIKEKDIPIYCYTLKISRKMNKKLFWYLKNTMGVSELP
jgi:hypothetical protein